jgi:hypothetical protein
LFGIRDEFFLNKELERAQTMRNRLTGHNGFAHLSASAILMSGASKNEAGSLPKLQSLEKRRLAIEFKDDRHSKVADLHSSIGMSTISWWCNRQT